MCGLRTIAICIFFTQQVFCMSFLKIPKIPFFKTSEQYFLDAIKGNHIELYKKYLEDANFSLQYKEDNGNTFLHCACIEGRNEIC